MCEDTSSQSRSCGQLGASLMAWSLVPRELTWLVLVQVCEPQVTLYPPAVGSLEVAGLGLGGPDDPEVDTMWPSPSQM